MNGNLDVSNKMLASKCYAIIDISGAVGPADGHPCLVGA